ncbi:MAG: DUF4974 domain-containing protein [Chitinophagaceae bacterium]|nr:DUF4974 domain-containing protein [Chitinophagaceae bacterium]
MKDEENSAGRHAHKEPDRIAYLVAGYLRQTLSEAEHDELDDWMTARPENQVLFEQLTDPALIGKGFQSRENIDTEGALERVKSKIRLRTRPEKTIKKQRFIRYGIAASLLLLAGTMFFLSRFRNEKPGIAGVTQADIQPGSNTATLSLGNGKIVQLGEAKNGLLDSTNGHEILKTADGQLSYEPNTMEENQVQHVLTTPAGGQYCVRLSDGSRVWLNASSSLTYPASFGKSERIVSLTGEGYFEVVHDDQGEEARKFIVNIRDGGSVEVTGTRFNIMAYDDEVDTRTTLLEGGVIARTKSMTVPMIPGDQTAIARNGIVEKSSGVDTSAVVSWKNGLFEFQNAPIETVMRQVARWYNATIIYEGNVFYHFTATINRHEPVSKLLSLLEATNRVHFRVSGKYIIVTP